MAGTSGGAGAGCRCVRFGRFAARWGIAGWSTHGVCCGGGARWGATFEICGVPSRPLELKTRGRQLLGKARFAALGAICQRRV